MRGRKGIVTLLLGLVLGCESGGGTGVSNPPSNPGKSLTGAVAALFSNSSEASISKKGKIPAAVLKFFVKRAMAQEECSGDPGCTCEEALLESEPAGDAIEDSPFAAPGTYGAAGSTIEVDEDDFCSQPDGVTENSTQGPDGRGRFAAFTLAGGVTGTCMDADGDEISVIMQSGSSGIWRNTEETGEVPAHEPEIYGTFVLEVGGASDEFDCTVFLGPAESVLSADCSDEEGNSVAQDVNANCSFDSGEGRE